MVQMWEIRPRNQCFDAIRIYEGYPTMFTIELHHGGRFTKFPGISYIEGKLDHIDLVDMDEFSVHELDEVMLKLGYDVPPVIYYHYQLPNGDLEFGLRALGNDIDVLSLAQYIEHHKIIKVYTEHNETKLLTYFMSPRVKPRVIIEEIADDVPTATVGDQDVPNLELCLVRYETPEYNSNKRLRLVDGSQSCSKKLCFNLEHTATVGDQDAHVEIGNEGANISEQGATVSGQDTHVEIGNEGANVSDQGAAVGDQDTEVHDQGANVGDQEVNTREFDTFDDQPFQFEDFDPFFDQYTFNDGNDQSMGVGAELGTRLGEVQFESEGDCEGLGEGGSERGSEGGSEGSEEDSDFLEDEENYVSDIEVDMSDFYMNVDLDVEYVDRGKGVETENEVVDTEDVEDVEVIDNDEWDSLGEDSDDERRKAILKQMVKEKKCSLGEVHTVTFQVGQKYKSKKEIKDKVNKLAIETRRNLGFKKNDKTRLRVVCKECLGDDLELYSNSNFTFMSDRQKGLLPAIAQLYPQAEHRFCLRHIYENMRKKWKTKEYKDHLWQCAIATTVPEFEHYMNELNKFDKDAFEWLKKIPPHHWARSHFSGRAGSDILLNNLCEVFNSKLIHGRNKPIISCLEYIRQYLMKRICNVKKVMSKAPGPLTPTASKLLERNREASVQYRARWNGTAKYEVYGPWHDQHVVDMTNMSCTCRRWELNGIPCRHAIATIHEMADSGDKVGELYTYVNKVYWLQTWNEAYSYTVDPIKGRAMWPKSTCPFQLTPPPHHNQPGRPKTKRKRSADEKYDKQMQNHGAGEPEKLTRKFVSVGVGNATIGVITQGRARVKVGMQEAMKEGMQEAVKEGMHDAVKEGMEVAVNAGISVFCLKTYLLV
ncbi:unnamed protein product [Lactuca saligna]|uniref:SWIM-type domain-containing protein n=1 Tax=Lactuca saligna TaxID=75948 RepID=A0AA35Z4T4_LACSI|nr:unnamed protein product [Lactuca saligna]